MLYGKEKTIRDDGYLGKSTWNGKDEKTKTSDTKIVQREPHIFRACRKPVFNPISSWFPTDPVSNPTPLKPDLNVAQKSKQKNLHFNNKSTINKIYHSFT